MSEVAGVAVFDQKLFEQTFAQTAGRKVELAVNLSPSFGGTIAGKDDQSGLYRIDLYVADAEPNLGPQIDALFGWPGNNCLSSAVRNVLQHCNPRGSNVYTYFVRMN